MTTRIRAAVLISFLASSAVVTAAPQQTLLTGTVSYRERIALSSTAAVEVRLEDVTRPDAAPTLVAITRMTGPGQVPIRFNLDVDMSRVDRRGRYALRATISDGGIDLFASMDTVLVLTQGHGTRADLVLTRVGSPKPAPAPQAPPAPPLAANLLTDLPATFISTLPCSGCEGIRLQLNLFGDDVFTMRQTQIKGDSTASTDDIGSWTLSSDRKIVVLSGQAPAVWLFEFAGPGTLKRLDPNGRPDSGLTLTRSSTFRPFDVHTSMRGAYTSGAGAATFIECSTGRRWPVAADAASRDLEAAYGKARPKSGAAVLMQIEAMVADRPKPDGGVVTSLVATRLERVLPNERCAARFSGTPLADTYWRLTHLGARAVPAATDPRREVYVTFMNDGRSFTGASGCNRLVGTYDVSDDRMTLTSGGTMIACRDEAKTEAAFIAALKETRTFRILGRVLELRDAKGDRIARFEARVPTGITVR